MARQDMADRAPELKGGIEGVDRCPGNAERAAHALLLEHPNRRIYGAHLRHSGLPDIRFWKSKLHDGKSGTIWIVPQYGNDFWNAEKSSSPQTC
jgi:hypothetical protein